VEDVVTVPMANALAADLERALAQAPATWAELGGARVFLTGGTGFVGSWLLETLLWANDRLSLGASVVVLTRDRHAFAKKTPHLANQSVTVGPFEFHTDSDRRKPNARDTAIA